MKENNKISKKMSFSEIIKKNPELAEEFMKEGLHCVGCPMAMMETLEEGAMAHGLDADKLVDKINKNKKKKEK